MLERIREARKNESGFTLIELLIVIVILGVLAGIVVFAVSAFNGDGNTAACKADTKNVEIASEAFYAKATDGKYAADIAGLVSAGFLKEAPSSDKYTISYTGGGGTTAPTIVGNLGTGASVHTTNDCK